MDTKDVDPPAYTESSTSFSPNLHSQISTIRSNRISTLINSTLIPLLNIQASSGLSHKILILVPSDITPLQHPSQDSKEDPLSPSLPSTDHPLGFPPEVSVQLIHLHGTDNVLEFWRQPAVITQLQADLASHYRLSRQPLDTPKTLEPSSSFPVASSSTLSPPRSKPGFFSRVSAKAASKPRAGWSIGEDTKPAVLGAGEVKVEVKLTEVSVRVVTEMGLYETRSGQGVVVDVQIGD